MDHSVEVLTLTKEYMLLRCGPFTVFYENGFLRHLKHGDDEILRMIYFALRDENWGTFKVEIEDEKISHANSGFVITYSAVNRQGEENLFVWDVKIEGSNQGIISMSIDGEAKASLKKNRAGFCVLHPLRGIFNQPVEITHPDGTRTTSLFPEFVDPENPFKEIQSMRWCFAKHWYELSFSGDIFETEDQRNWTDASYKTFCTPLRLPFPVELEKGKRISQQVIFKPVDALLFKEPAEQITIRRIAGTNKPLPRIGVGVSPHRSLTMTHANLIRALKLDHLRIDIRLYETTWFSQLESQIMALSACDTAVELALHLGANAEASIGALANYLKENKIPVRQVLLFSQGQLTTLQSHITLAHIIHQHFPGAFMGAGTDHNFTELNRHRFKADALDFVSFAIDPQEHATDSLTIVENLEAQTDTIRSAYKIYERSVHVSPVALKRRSNPYATNPTKMDVPESEQSDPRQATDFCAAWTLGSIKAASAGKASSVTYHQVAGPLGITQDEKALPVYHALKQIQALRHLVIENCESSHPLVADAILFNNGDLLVWNYTGDEQRVTLPDGKEFIMKGFAFELVFR